MKNEILTCEKLFQIAYGLRTRVLPRTTLLGGGTERCVLRSLNFAGRVVLSGQPEFDNFLILHENIGFKNSTYRIYEERTVPCQ